MQLLRESTIHAGGGSSTACARAVLDSVPFVMQFIRHAAAPRKAAGLSVQQFRALGVLRHHHRNGASLSDVAEYLGLSLPTASRLVDGLVSRGLIHRRPLPENRRQVRLTLQPAGAKMLEAAVETAQDALEQRLRHVSPAQRRRITAAARDLRALFDPAASAAD
jgi:DNA-binding MarR family transcriptional regulator